jgi:putative ABC transport system ATP-binding protein
MDRVIGLRDGRIADNILQEYYHVNLAPEELELPVREMAPVPVPVLKPEQE